MKEVQLECIDEYEEKDFLKDNVIDTIAACNCLVKWVIKKYFLKYKKRNFNEDMMQCGDIGIYKAYNSFKEGKGASFKTFACSCVKNEIQNFLDSYIGKKGLSKYELNNEGLISLDAPRSDTDDDLNLYNFIAIYSENKNFSNVENRLALEKAMFYLKDNERFIIERLLQGKKQNQIAKEMHLSAERVGKLKKRAFGKLKGLIN